MKTLIVSATRKSNPKKTELYKSLQAVKSVTSDELKLKLYNNNSTGLPELYNKNLTIEVLSEYECILFVHDDVFIDDLKVIEKIKTNFSNGYSVVGLAGASDVKIKEPVLWHLMSDQKSWSGAVAHPSSDGGVYVTSFGSLPKRCLIMDGLFLAIDCKKFKTNVVNFDTQFTFHHYDIDFCLQCNNAKHKLTTAHINVIHQSPGLLNVNDSIFSKSQKLFLNKYGKN